MLLDSKVVGANTYKAGTIFPNENVPELLDCLHRYVKQGLARYIAEDQPIDVSKDIANLVGEIKLPDQTPEQKETVKTIIEEEKRKRGNPNFRSTGKKHEKNED
jgi:hypothetical protein